MKKTTLTTTIAAVLGVTALVGSSIANAGVITASWTGYFALADTNGVLIANTSIAPSSNQFVTPISGTLQFDDATGAGSATLVPFGLLGGVYPFSASSIELQAIGDGLGGAGSLVLGNALFDWNGTSGIPVSMVLDAAGFLASEYSSGGANSAVPAIDGTYIGSVPGTLDDANGYLAMGAMPIVTTAWNTSFGNGCTTSDGNTITTPDGCMGISPSGVLPLVLDTAQNDSYDAVANTGGAGTWNVGSYNYYNGIGGNPMADGPFLGSNVNFNIGTIAQVAYDANATLDANCSWDPSGNCFQTPQVPVPAAAWLFGSGLIGLLGMARKRKPTL